MRVRVDPCGVILCGTSESGCLIPGVEDAGSVEKSDFPSFLDCESEDFSSSSGPSPKTRIPSFIVFPFHHDLSPPSPVASFLEASPCPRLQSHR